MCRPFGPFAGVGGYIEIPVSDLRPCHQLLLLKVEDEADKLHYARRAILEHLSTRGLRNLLIKEGYIARPGRPPRGELDGQRAHGSPADDLPGPIAILESVASTALPLESLSPEQIRKALEAAKRARQRLDTLIKELESA
jgi:hypothetical protein